MKVWFLDFNSKPYKWNVCIIVGRSARLGTPYFHQARNIYIILYYVSVIHPRFKYWNIIFFLFFRPQTGRCEEPPEVTTHNSNVASAFEYVQNFLNEILRGDDAKPIQHKHNAIQCKKEKSRGQKSEDEMECRGENEDAVIDNSNVTEKTDSHFVQKKQLDYVWDQVQKRVLIVLKRGLLILKTKKALHATIHKLMVS